MNQDQDIITKSQENLKKYKFMVSALKQAEKAALQNEVPVGAVVVYQDKIIARAYNKREQNQEIHAHAEFLAMMKAAKKIGSWRLEDCDIYVTMEPCPMCAGAMIQSRIRNLYYGAKDPKAGVAESLTRLFELSFNHKVHVESGMMAEESQKILKSFFKKLRNK
ncbi:MAG TPA: tRNA-specific adenosine deaminase [Acholeplasmataceae bacterium]|nr:MAG: tRNA-specific adenosine deaminase [Tenericutes bacterium GWA2_38_26]OHE31301.1 MAG: tRNA-specific adenosine deaminase [Tenericutes bacterium GWC2_39_45]OHE32470.1 MAG: tRNA-specific adenosine deaminase [Tenericutes bacterium GWD2_38_27]OHE40047.1 MAG: tRNA-specific adenosine deaminase [Tenericutes bacterium GWE2_38_8]OHE45455.1 MAG: tRNA-specific adenosine deaminase [Tenericutes bacterium GWF2_38_8]HBG32924.1 tRNA-specific adenosine deaminase [Acholeplasmataceae bacterium]